MGIEPTSAAWEAAILPLNHARFGFYPNKQSRTPASRLRARVKSGGHLRKCDVISAHPFAATFTCCRANLCSLQK